MILLMKRARRSPVSPRPSRRPWLLLVLLVAAGAGCAQRRQPTVADWQATVGQYVRDAGGPAALRDAPGPDGRPGFSVLGGDRPESSTDVHGLLLGRRLVAGRPWVVFLVGRVNRQSVEDIRLAALADSGSGPGQWVMGEPDAAALAQYRQFNDALWRRRFPGRAEAPPEYLSFPRREDAFELTVAEDQGRVSATHPASGARWELLLPAPTAAPATRPVGGAANRG